MDYDRLRELQQKFEENPRRYFAPLANEYRKGGQPKRAIEICRTHLAQMPGHMSGQIVFGQALFEAGEYDEARKVFEHALVLDPENLIALRSLGDMSLQSGDTTEARSWYTRLLDADPKDSEVIALVSEIDSALEAAPTPAAEEIAGVDPDRGDQQIPAAAEIASAAAEAAPPAGFEATSKQEETAPVGAGGGGEDTTFTGASAEPFVNETMAQLYLKQGYRQLALKVYRQLAHIRPNDQSLKDRMAEIEAAEAAAYPAEARKEEPSIERPTPAPAPEPSPIRAPSIESPAPSRQRESEEAPSFDEAPSEIERPGAPSREHESIEAPSRDEPRAEPAGIAARQPSIREFFATLGRRKPPRPSAGGGSGGGAGGRKSPVASMPTQSSSLDNVFAGATVNPSDSRAASRLAGAFSGGTRGSTTPQTPAVPTPRVNPRIQTQESEEDVAKFRAWLDGLTGE